MASNTGGIPTHSPTLSEILGNLSPLPPLQLDAAFPAPHQDWDSVLNNAGDFIPLPLKEGQQNAGISSACLGRVTDPALQRLLLSMLDPNSAGADAFKSHHLYPDLLVRSFHHEGTHYFATGMLVEGSEAGTIDPVAQVRIENRGNPYTVHILSDPEVWPSSFLDSKPITIVASRRSEEKPVLKVPCKWVLDVLPSLNKEQRAILLLSLKKVDGKKLDSLLQFGDQPFIGYGFKRAGTDYLALFFNKQHLNSRPAGIQNASGIQIKPVDDSQNLVVDISQSVQASTVDRIAARLTREAQQAPDIGSGKPSSGAANTGEQDAEGEEWTAADDARLLGALTQDLNRPEASGSGQGGKAKAPATSSQELPVNDSAVSIDGLIERAKNASMGGQRPVRSQQIKAQRESVAKALASVHEKNNYSTADFLRRLNAYDDSFKSEVEAALKKMPNTSGWAYIYPLNRIREELLKLPEARRILGQDPADARS
jgi:hypothetical protein